MASNKYNKYNYALVPIASRHSAYYTVECTLLCYYAKYGMWQLKLHVTLEDCYSVTIPLIGIESGA